MTYKGMFLSALLVPVAVTSYGKTDIDQKIQQLKETRFQKELELSDLGAKITEKQELLDHLFDLAVKSIRKTCQSLDLDGKEREKFFEQVDVSSKEFEDLLKRVINEKKVNGFLVKELFDEQKDVLEKFETVKFCVVRGFFETNLLKELVSRYENCMHELITIDSELKAFSN